MLTDPTGRQHPFSGTVATHALCALRHIQIACASCAPGFVTGSDVRADLMAARELLSMALEGMGIDPVTHQVQDPPSVPARAAQHQ